MRAESPLQSHKSQHPPFTHEEVEKKVIINQSDSVS